MKHTLRDFLFAGAVAALVMMAATWARATTIVPISIEDMATRA